MSNIIAIIPARSGSKSLIDKNIKDLDKIDGEYDKVYTTQNGDKIFILKTIKIKKIILQIYQLWTIFHEIMNITSD